MPARKIIRITPDSQVEQSTLKDFDTQEDIFFVRGDTVVFQITPLQDGSIDDRVMDGTLFIECKADNSPATLPFFRESTSDLSPPSTIDSIRSGSNTAEITIPDSTTEGVLNGRIAFAIYWVNAGDRVTYFAGGITVHESGVVDGQNPQPIVDRFQLLSEKGRPNGYAGLNSQARLFSANLPDSILSGGDFLGGVAGDSVPNTAPRAGDWYYITSDGTSQGIDWTTGDRAVYDGTSGSWTHIQIDVGPVPPNDTVRNVATIAELRTLDGTAFPMGQFAWVQAYSTLQNNKYSGGGLFILDQSGNLGSGADNGGTIISAIGGTNWYWLRANIQEISPEMFGAQGDWNGDITEPMGTDDSTAFQNCLNYAQSRGNCTVRLPTGARYQITEILNVFAGTIIEGSNSEIGFIPATTMDFMSLASNSASESPPEIRNLQFEGGSNSQHGILASNTAKIENCNGYMPNGDCIRFNSSGNLFAFGNTFRGQTGITTTNGRLISVIHNRFDRCDDFAINIQNSQILDSQNNSFERTNDAENNPITSNNISVIRAVNTQVSDKGSYFEQNKCAIFDIQNAGNRGLVFEDFRFSDQGNETAREIVLNRNAAYINIGAGSADSSQFSAIVNNLVNDLTTKILVETGLDATITERFVNVEQTNIRDTEGEAKYSANEFQIYSPSNSFRFRGVTENQQQFMNLLNSAGSELFSVNSAGQTFIGGPKQTGSTAQANVSVDSNFSGDLFNILKGSTSMFRILNDGNIGTRTTNEGLGSFISFAGVAGGFYIHQYQNPNIAPQTSILIPFQVSPAIGLFYGYNELTDPSNVIHYTSKLIIFSISDLRLVTEIHSEHAIAFFNESVDANNFTFTNISAFTNRATLILLYSGTNSLRS